MVCPRACGFPSRCELCDKSTLTIVSAIITEKSCKLQEMQSILDLLKIPINYIEKPCVMKPYWVVELPSEECAKQIASRSVLLRNCIELWSRAKTETQLHQNLQEAYNNSTGKWLIKNNSSHSTSDLHVCPKELIENCCSEQNSFKVDVETFCKHFKMKEKVEKIEVNIYLIILIACSLQKGTWRIRNFSDIHQS